MSTIEEVLASRAQKYVGQPRFAAILRAVDRALATSEHIRDKAAENAKDGHLSAVGRRDKNHKFVAEKAHEVIRARKAVEKAKARAEQKKAALKLPTPDPTEGPMRSEMRQMLRNMPSSEKARLLIGSAADPAFIRAALEGHNALSGINDQLREMLVAQEIEKAFPGAMSKIEMEMEVIELLEVSAQILCQTAASVADIPSDHLLQEFVSKAVPDVRHIDSDLDQQFAAAA